MEGKSSLRTLLVAVVLIAVGIIIYLLVRENGNGPKPRKPLSVNGIDHGVRNANGVIDSACCAPYCDTIGITIKIHNTESVFDSIRVLGLLLNTSSKVDNITYYIRTEADMAVRTATSASNGEFAVYGKHFVPDGPDSLRCDIKCLMSGGNIPAGSYTFEAKAMFSDGSVDSMKTYLINLRPVTAPCQNTAARYTNVR
jgi:hypothetical protein